MMDLKPCPFCGPSTQYECGMCGCHLETGEEWDHGRRWNQRPAEDHLKEEIVRLQDEVHEWEESDKAGPVITACLKADAEIARLAREYVAAYKADNASLGSETLAPLFAAQDALIAAVDREGNS